ncbi:site-specific integrase [Caulobacter sp. 3R27C2-B]|uniref:tyrosine-type recombinase/integrase n=1 Tax=Caulobacter sp. 3R27C2-B TaxID=2502219 RepID=UPI0010F94EFA|nr:site-specific integrase [Caulobacter sp. 3R27C2-B]
MARQINKLPPKAATAITAPGRYSDGGGLYLVVGAGGSRKWVFRFRWNGRLRDMGLGGTSNVTLAKAREKAAAARALIGEGTNPLEAKQAVKAIPTFGAFADELVSVLSTEWRNDKHKAQWTTTLTKDAAPLRALRLDRIETAHVLETLKPIWSVKPETASRLQQRIARVLDAAKAKGYRSGENPARWSGHLDNLLPARQKLTRGHHAALPYPDVPDFIAKLRARDAVAALALEFVILTAARSGEVRGATWAEFDLASKVWTVPASRMKAGREHRVPLSASAVAVLLKVKPLTGGKADAFVFPSKTGTNLSDAAFSALFIRMGLDRGAITPHGFRSSFRDWAGEASTFPREVAEAALAHNVGDATERAYRRGDALEKRRKLMEAWAGFCEPRTAGSVVVPMGRRVK